VGVVGDKEKGYPAKKEVLDKTKRQAS